MSKRKELESRQREESRKRTLQIAGIIAGIAIVVIGGAAFLSSRVGPLTPPEVPLPAPRAVNKQAPPNAAAKAPAWGPENAPVKIEEYVDYQCPACGAQWAANEQPINQAFANTGKVRFEVKYRNLIQTFRPGSTESRDAANAALCAADQDKFWQMHDLLMGNQIDENVGQFSTTRLKTMGAFIAGLDQTAFAACIDGGTHHARVDAMDAEAQTRGVNSTPTFFVNGKILPGGGKGVNDLRQAITQIAPDVKLD
jgi:protein-disulfide isomerase